MPGNGDVYSQLNVFYIALDNQNELDVENLQHIDEQIMADMAKFGPLFFNLLLGHIGETSVAPFLLNPFRFQCFCFWILAPFLRIQEIFWERK